MQIHANVCLSVIKVNLMRSVSTEQCCDRFVRVSSCCLRVGNSYQYVHVICFPCHLSLLLLNCDVICLVPTM